MAQIIAKKLGFVFFHRSIIREIARSVKMSEKVIDSTVAPLNVRVKNMVETFGASPEETKKRVLRKDTINVINHLTLTGSPAMQARGKKLLKRLRFAAS